MNENVQHQVDDAQTIFADYAAAYAAQGLVVFPCDTAKKPLVKNHLSFVPETQARLTGRFPAANIGIVLAPPRGRALTVVDIDCHDKAETAAVMHECVKAFGDTPIKVSTPGGGAHLWYRASKIGRRIRPLAGLPVDVLAGGIGVAPPSQRGAGAGYRFTEGSLADVDRLPAIPAERAQQLSRSKPVISPADDRRIAQAAGEKAQAPKAGDPIPWEKMGEGHGRNDALFRWGLRHVAAASDRSAFASTLHGRNSSFGVPLGVAEVDSIAAKVWTYREQGRVMRPAEQNVIVSAAYLDLARQCPDALALLILLISAHGAKHGEPFVLANAMAGSLGWRLSRWRAARDALIECGALKILSRGGRGRNDPPMARLTS